MKTQLDILEAQALKLPTSERARLAERLIASLDEDAEIKEAWAWKSNRVLPTSKGAERKRFPQTRLLRGHVQHSRE